MRHLPLRYLDLEIGDVIRFERLLWRITELTQGAVLELSAVRHQPQIFGAYKTLEEEADTASGSGQIARPELWLFELPAPALRHHAGADAAPLVAAFAAPWPQSVQLRREGASALTVAAPSLMGNLASDLPALSEASVGRWDRHSSFDVTLYGGTLAALPARDVLAGGNRLAVETDRGWEIIQFARAELIGERLYRLSYLLRGQFGSDGIGDARAGARCIILGAAQTPLAASPDHVPQSLAFRFGPPNLPQDGYGWQGGRYDMRRTALAAMILPPRRYLWGRRAKPIGSPYRRMRRMWRSGKARRMKRFWRRSNAAHIAPVALMPKTGGWPFSKSMTAARPVRRSFFPSQ